MSEGPENSPQAEGEEEHVERVIREILEPLDRNLTWTDNVVLGLWFLATATAFFLLWLRWDFRWWTALLTSLVGTFLLLCLVLPLRDTLLLAGALQQFEEWFPKENRQRPMALHILSEMRSPSQTEVKLQEALMTRSPERIVRHQRPESQTHVQPVLPPAPGTVSPPPAPAKPEEPRA